MRHIDKAVALLLAGACITGEAVAAGPDYAKMARDMLSSDFRSKGPATVERVTQQDEVQKICSEQPAARSKKVDAKIEASQLKTIVYPADGAWLGKWEEGEKIAQNGRGMQSSDAVGSVNGGNCYACHQLRKEEIAFGNIGPSLYQYGKLRGQSPEIMRYTWGKIFNSQAFKACSSMPRFGHNGILTEAQIRDVMALLLDPASPVNQ
ncbi:MAG TPA: sulfur oxidation c-type cytochrome SoxX [Burkholderiaceae bacterium]|nr:sulfur oxidation c-type cytochrome SoxX [Burkholderiaceae bacterium]